ncbi:YIP1 family protein [Natronorarus salvus]|uniref:YIP1 family protein n=1 Tax=Natronorarus salvus TaxID=3117733 RepID=UPI002F269BBE
MTQWIEESTGGRDRGPRAVVRAWIEVLTRPRRFFSHAVAPGDQAPGLTFAICVVLGALLVRLVSAPESYPTIGDQRVLSVALVIGLVGLLVAPLALHLVAALQTVLLIPFVPDRGGVSETVQVIGYASAPGLFAGLPVPEVQALAAVYGTLLLVVGVSVVHGVSLARAGLLAAAPAYAVFGVGFGGAGATLTVLATWGLM